MANRQIYRVYFDMILFENRYNFLWKNLSCKLKKITTKSSFQKL